MRHKWLCISQTLFNECFSCLQTLFLIDFSGVYKQYDIIFLDVYKQYLFHFFRCLQLNSITLIFQVFTNSKKLIFQVFLSHRETGRGPGRIPCHGLSKEGHGHTRTDARARVLPRAKSSGPRFLD